jgi:hypothetical protein
LLRWHVSHIYQLNVEDQISLRRYARMSRIGTRPALGAIRELPGNKQPPLAADLHAVKSLVEPRNQAAKPLREGEWLRIAELRLAVFAQHRLAVLVLHRLAVIVR